MKKVDLNKYDNSWYSIGASYPKQLLWYFINILIFMNPLFPFSSIKGKILRLFGAKIGLNFYIKPRVNIKYPWFLDVGNYVSIGEGVWIDNLCQVKMGNHVCISQDAYILTGNHNYKKTGFDLILGEIKIDDGVWIGAKSVVCPGVKCGSHSILTVGSIAISNLEEYGIYQGNPAVFKKKRLIEE